MFNDFINDWQGATSSNVVESIQIVLQGIIDEDNQVFRYKLTNRCLQLSTGVNVFQAAVRVMEVVEFRFEWVSYVLAPHLPYRTTWVGTFVQRHFLRQLMNVVMAIFMAVQNSCSTTARRAASRLEKNETMIEYWDRDARRVCTAFRTASAYWYFFTRNKSRSGDQCKAKMSREKFSMCVC